MTILWGKDSQVSCGSVLADAASGEHTVKGLTLSPETSAPSVPVVTDALPAGKTSGLSTDSVAQSEKAGRPATPRVYSAWIDDYSDDLYQFAEPSYTPRSTFSERVAEIALGGFILLAVVCGLAAKFNW